MVSRINPGRTRSVGGSPAPEPGTFARVMVAVREARLRPEVVVEEVPAPTRLAPQALALSGEVYPTRGPSEESVATGRFVLLHDPSAPEPWEGVWRIVTYAKATVEPEVGHDQLVGEVGWSWLTDALSHRGLAWAAEAGAVTCVLSESFGALADRGHHRRAGDPRLVEPPGRPHRGAPAGLGRPAVHDRRPAASARGRQRVAGASLSAEPEVGEPGEPGAPEGEPEAPEVTQLTEPAQGVPAVVASQAALAATIEALQRGTGPVAIDAERASGYRYGQRAYLVQLRRAGSGTSLVDPVALPDLSALNAVIAQEEWVLHAATQDLPCLAEVGLAPTLLFDTELGARLAGLPRVGLAAVLEHYLGIGLAKEHSAVDWSTRPLPEPWLRYAALDVELLVEVRDAVAADLEAQGKTEWARQEFAALTSFTLNARRADPWRRTSGMHRVRSRRAAALVRELWRVRDTIAQERDVAPGRVLPDATLVDLAIRAPRTAAGLTGDGGVEDSHSRQRRAHQGLLRHRRHWLDAIRDGADLPDADLPDLAKRTDTPPPARAWPDRDPAAAARLAQAREALSALSEQHAIPVENLLTPETLRRALWQPPGPPGSTPDAEAVVEFLTEQGARAWQVELTAPVIVQAFTDHPG